MLDEQAIDWWERAGEAVEAQDLPQAVVYYQKAESIALAYMQWLNRCVWPYAAAWHAAAGFVLNERAAESTSGVSKRC